MFAVPFADSWSLRRASSRLVQLMSLPGARKSPKFELASVYSYLASFSLPYMLYRAKWVTPVRVCTITENMDS